MVFFVRSPRAPASRSFVVDGPPAALRRHRERRVEPPREEAASEQVREDAIPALGDPRRPRRPVGFEPGVFRLRAFGFTVVVVVVPAVVVVPIVVSDADASRRGDAHRPRGALAGFAREQDEPLRLHEEEGLLRVQEQPRAARVAQLREVFPSAAEHLRDAGSLAPRRDGDGVGRDPRGGAPRRAQVPEPREEARVGGQGAAVVTRVEEGGGRVGVGGGREVRIIVVVREARVGGRGGRGARGVADRGDADRLRAAAAEEVRRVRLGRGALPRDAGHRREGRGRAARPSSGAPRGAISPRRRAKQTSSVVVVV